MTLEKLNETLEFLGVKAKEPTAEEILKEA